MSHCSSGQKRQKNRAPPISPERCPMDKKANPETYRERVQPPHSPLRIRYNRILALNRNNETNRNKRMENK